jgi:hypothetical protein
MATTPTDPQEFAPWKNMWLEKQERTENQTNGYPKMCAAIGCGHKTYPCSIAGNVQSHEKESRKHLEC